MEEMLYKFIDEGKREHEEIRAFICEFRTTNKILFKERNNSLSEQRFEVQELLKVIDNTPMTNYEIKRVTTRGGKMTTHDVQTNSTNVHTEEPVVVNHDKPVESNEVLDKDQPQTTNKPVIQTSSEEQTPSIPFPRRLRKEKEEAQQRKLLENLKQLHINFPFIEALAQMPKYAKFLKGLPTNKARLEEACTITIDERCSTVLLNKLPSKEKDPGSFTIPCDIGQLHINNTLADLGASISLMPYTMYEKLGLGEPKATRMSLGLMDRVPIILGRPLLATAQAMIDVFNKRITLRVGDDEVILAVEQSIKIHPADDDECYGIDDLDDIINAEAQELLTNDRSDSFLLKGLEKSTNQSDLESCESLENKAGRSDEVKSEHLYSGSANEIDQKRPELKSLPNHLEYTFLQGDKSFPIIISSKLSEKEKKLLFDFAVGAVLGQRINGKFKPIYYASKILNNAQDHYTTTEKELLAVDAKPRLIRWVLLLQGFDIEIKDKEGVKNLAADHLSRLENPDLGTFTEDEITDEFPDKHQMILKVELSDDEPWYADYVNYIVGKIVPSNWMLEKRRRLFSQVKNYFWDEPYVFRLCPKNVMRRCVAGSEILEILAHCHSGPTMGHHSASITRRKVYESGLFWPSIFKDAKDYLMRCDACQRSGNISSRSEMPQNNIQNCLQNAYWMYPFKLVYGKACHLPMEIKHRAYWALKQCNMDLTAATKNYFMELNELMELRYGAYENTRIYKERTKKWHESRIRGYKNFKVGDKVLQFNSRFKMHPGKLKSKWYGPNVVKTMYPHGTVEITDKNGF
ncbi:reverse transcriptase domain-containing protein [Tanacetum coccineum]